jgi:hypothetical protein
MSSKKIWRYFLLSELDLIDFYKNLGFIQDASNNEVFTLEY